MKEINISKVIIKYRKNMKITQQELAEFLGVSKASVSKWELGISYPDITLLPLIASYFNISLDSLMDYEPTLNKEQIKEKYMYYCKEFACKEFQAVIDELNGDIKKYYSCYEYLLTTIILLINHYELALDKDKYIDKIINLINHILDNSKDFRIIDQVRNLKMTCYILNNQPQEVINMSGNIYEPHLNNELLVSNAYMMLNKLEEAEEIYQIFSFNSILAILSYNMGLIQLNINNKDRLENIIHKTDSIIETYELLKVQPYVLLNYYYLLISIYINYNDLDKMEIQLKKFHHVCNHIKVLEIKGDDYFNKLDKYIKNAALGNITPRSSKLIKSSIKNLFDVSLFDDIRLNDKYNKIIKEIYLAVDNID